MTDRELMQQAMKLLILWLDEQEEPDKEATIEALRARLAEPMINGLTEKETAETMSVKGLAQPEPEPVAWRFRTGTWWNREGHWRYVLSLEGTEGLQGLEPLYTAPPQRECASQVHDRREWQGLTDEEAMQTWEGIIKYAPSEIRVKDFARAIEAKLKAKNDD